MSHSSDRNIVISFFSFLRLDINALLASKPCILIGRNNRKQEPNRVYTRPNQGQTPPIPGRGPTDEVHIHEGLIYNSL